MKTLFSMALISFSLSSYACLDLSGTYIFDDGKNQETTFIQHGCSTVDVKTGEGDFTIIVDGKFHQNISQDVIMEGENVGHIKVSHKASFTENKFILDSEIHLNMFGYEREEYSESVNTILPNGDMKSITIYTEEGRKEVSIGKRIK